MHPDSPTATAQFENATYAKVTLRLLPFLFICYVAAYLDRVNVGFAKLQMLNDLKFSESVYGLGAGIFFIGYFLFEVPYRTEYRLIYIRTRRRIRDGTGQKESDAGAIQRGGARL